MGVLGTSITEEDAQRIIQDIKTAYSGIPYIVKQFMPTIPELINRIPLYVRKYTLEDVIQLLRWAYDQGHIS